MTTTITTNDKRHASSWELAADIERVTVVAARGDSARITDSSALAIAAGWQSPGYQGRAFASLASTGSVDLNALADNILHAWQEANERDRDALDLLLLWAYHHPSLSEEDENEED
ncbi:hypothetical protein AB0L64_36270 [Kribbella sp. NPDC051936]|uniref:hypothetical protein n=1 Tax=Kribbella sp. NPDC051936 TaxID=3154946 RepID=UPI0034264E75